jgi:hypothetical protein
MVRYRNEDSVLAMFNRFFHLCETKEQKTLVLDMKQAFLEIIPSDATPKSAWISVDERLPEKDGRYLVAMKNGNDYHISTRKFKRSDPPIWWKGHIYGRWARHTGGVRYWMPLPEPPKGVADEN